MGLAQASASQAAGAEPTLSPFFKPRGGALRNIDLGSGSPHFQPVAMNAQGLVVGTVGDGLTVQGSKKWTAARGHEDLPVPPYYESVVVYDVDDAGNIVLSARQADFTTPFLLSASGVFTELACPDDRECVPTSMNAAGVVVGYATDGERQDVVVWDQLTQYPRALETPPAVWDPVAVDINASGVIIGTATMQDSFRPTTAVLVWTNSARVATMIPNATARAVNGRGQIAGASWNTGEGLDRGHACTWDARTGGAGKVVLRSFGADLPSVANDVNEAGLVVGAAADSTGTFRAVTF